MLKHRLFATLFLVLTSLSLSAQQMDIIVIGQVLDGEDGMPIEGAKVSFVGGKSFTLTNSEGYFYLTSGEQQKAVMVEMSGYKSKRQKLDRSLRDQAIEVVLQKDLNLLEEVVVTPSKNKMREILSGIDKNRYVNSSENLYGFEAEIRTFDKLYIAGIQRRLLEKRLFSEIRKGMLMERDSSLILPVHFSKNVVKKTFQEGRDLTETIEEQSNTLELFGENNIREIIQAYVPTVDFYRRNVLMFGKTFPSPTSKNGLLYYRYTIRDSIFADNSLSYLIDFRPKNLKSLAFRGTMLIDAKNFALRHIEAEIPNSANLNFLKDIAFEQSFFEVTDRRFLPERKEQTVSFFYDFSLGEHRYASAILKQQQELGNFRLLGDSLKIKHLEPQDPAEAEAMQAAIDTLNQTKLQKTLVAIADVLLNGYIHVEPYRGLSCDAIATHKREPLATLHGWRVPRLRLQGQGVEVWRECKPEVWQKPQKHALCRLQPRCVPLGLRRQVSAQRKYDWLGRKPADIFLVGAALRLPLLQAAGEPCVCFREKQLPLCRGAELCRLLQFRQKHTFGAVPTAFAEGSGTIFVAGEFCRRVFQEVLHAYAVPNRNA